MKNLRKLLCVTATLLLIVSIATAQTSDRWPVSMAGKWGFVNKVGRLVIPYKFQLARHFIGGLASVKVNGKWGAIRPDGAFVVSPNYVDISPCIGGRVVATRHKNWWDRNADVLGGRGRIIKQVRIEQLDPGEGGNVYSDPFTDLGSDFDYSAAAFLKSSWDPLSYSKTLRLQDHNLDGVAQWVNGVRGVGPRLEISYDPNLRRQDRSIDMFTIGGYFSSTLFACEEMYPVWSVTPVRPDRNNYNRDQDVLWGYMNLSGLVVAKPSFKWIEPYYGGLAKVGFQLVDDNRNPKGRWGYINKSGKWVWRSWAS